MNMGNSYSLGGTFSTLLLLLTKLLIIVLAVLVVLGVIAWIRDNFLKNKDSKLMQNVNEDPILKAVVVITASVIGLVLVFTLLSSLFNTGGMYYNHILNMTGIIMILIKLLMFILVISLVLAGIMYFKNQYENGNLTLNLFTTNNTTNSSNKENNNKIIQTQDEK